MRNALLVRIAIALAVLVLAAVGYAVFIPVKVLHSDLLGRLVVAQTGLPAIAAAPTFSASLPISTSSLSDLQRAAAASPGRTGNYASDWFAATSNGSSVTVQIVLMPSVATARSVLAQAESQDIAAAALKAGTHVLKSSFSVAGGHGVTYTTAQVAKAGTKPGPPVPGGALDARIGHVVFRETVSGKVTTKANMLALASRETALLERVEPSFPNIQTTDHPVLASVVYIVVALLTAAALALVPDWIRFARARRQAQQEVRNRRQYTTRGSKALRRHRVRI